MPGLNKQGPEGRGPMTGKQQGMCRRTDDLPLPDDSGFMGRGMGGRCRGFSYFGQRNQFRLGGGMGPHFTTSEADELAGLKDEYKKTQETLASLVKKIEGLEGR